MPSLKKKTSALRQRAAFVQERLHLRYPEPDTHLVAHTPWELLVATMLSAQCTDERVNKVTPALFQRWPTPETAAEAALPEMEEAVRSTGFYRNKAKNIIAAARKIVEEHQGRVPDRMRELLTLPGVARKTASVVLWGAFGRNEGLAVDTHVGRIAFRLGLTSNKAPEKVERDLMALFPQEEWGRVNHRLVWFGRHVCTARKPACPMCELESVCEKNGLPGAPE